MTDLVPRVRGADGRRGAGRGRRRRSTPRARSGPQEPYTHTVPFSHRSGQRIEPLISLQWFMKMDELAAPAIQVVKDGKVRIHPESQSRRYVDWLENIRPWCISRQLWWGHQIPVWYRGDETYVGHDGAGGRRLGARPRRPRHVVQLARCGRSRRSAGPSETPELKAFYPTDVLSTARDILFLWVARMVMMGLEFTGDIPFEHVYVHSVIQAPDGRRMSKSLGTGIDPVELIEAHGADGVRFGLLAMSSTQDVRFSEEKVAQGQALANKLFNATRFVLGQRRPRASTPAPRPQTVEDRWILSRLAAAREDFDARIAAFDFSKAALGLYDFVYGELCDWYLELIKGREFDARPQRARCCYVLRETLVLAHPIIPFVTEELWEHVPGTRGPAGRARARRRSPAPRDAERRARHRARHRHRPGRALLARRRRRQARRVPGRAPRAASTAIVPLVARLARLTPVADDAARAGRRRSP